MSKFSDVKKHNEKNQELAIRFGLGAIKAVGVGIMSDLVEVRKDGQFKDIYDFASRSGSKILNKKSVEALSKSGSFDSIHKNRHQIHQSCEIICKYGSSKEEEKNSSQMNLFSSASSIIIENPTLKDVKNWNKKERLQREFEAFGYFVNEHPLDDSLTDLKKRGVITSNIVNEEIVKDNSIVKLSGVVAYSKHRSGPKGRFAYLTLSDPIGIYETSIFSEDLITDFRDEMEAGNSLVVTCLVRKDDGGTRLMVREIELCEEFIKNTTASNKEYQDIKIQPKRKNNYGYQNKTENDYKNDILNLQNQHNKLIDSFNKKDILQEVSIKINQRDAIFNVKSFLSQKIAPQDFEKRTKIFIISQNQKIKLDNIYALDESDIAKIAKIDSVTIV